MLDGVNMRLEDLITVSEAFGLVTRAGAADGLRLPFPYKSCLPGPLLQGWLECLLCSSGCCSRRLHN